jgi:hypothetical protein
MDATTLLESVMGTINISIRSLITGDIFNFSCPNSMRRNEELTRLRKRFSNCSGKNPLLTRVNLVCNSELRLHNQSHLSHVRFYTQRGIGDW